MDAQRKLRNLLSCTKPDSVEELEDCNKLYEEILAHLNKQEKVAELLGLYKEKSDLLVQIANGKYLQDDYMKLLEEIDNLEKELGEMK